MKLGVARLFLLAIAKCMCMSGSNESPAEGADGNSGIQENPSRAGDYFSQEIFKESFKRLNKEIEEVSYQMIRLQNEYRKSINKYAEDPENFTSWYENYENQVKEFYDAIDLCGASHTETVSASNALKVKSLILEDRNATFLDIIKETSEKIHGYRMIIESKATEIQEEREKLMNHLES
ncbi:hypothetical protein ENBRE01_2391 [Enteropsectra breve]|nr:hypothetical protein ENBRE01_2391 [Enteropsectra breve]